jgi:hypothetical protein
MTRIFIDAALGAKLHELTEPAQICDPAGRILGSFTPTPMEAIYEGLEPQITKEELEQRAREGGGRTLAEILADLERRA